MFPLENFLFRHIHQEQLTDLTLISNENKVKITYKEYTMNVYANILIFFTNLQHLTIVPLSTSNCPGLFLDDLPPTTISSSTLTKLCINVFNFDTCLALLDGRLKKLTTLIVEVCSIDDESSTSYNNVSLCSQILSLSNCSSA